MAKAATKTKTQAKAAEPQWTPAIKGFKADLTCLDFQFQIGGEYKHEGTVRCCSGGFHAITDHPLAVFGYYAPAGSRFCRVEIGGATHSDDNVKTAAEIIRIGQELTIKDLVDEAVQWVLARSHPEGETATRDHGAASATGDQGAASATGSRGAASATGSRGAASATGSRGAASATGYRGAASATGDQGAAMTSGMLGQVRGAIGNALFACERETWDGPIISVACGIVGKEGIEPDVWYRCIGGKLARQ